MRNTTQLLVVLTVLLLTSCSSDDEFVPDALKTGKIFFEIKEDPMKPIKLSNARSSNQKTLENRYELIFMQDGEIVAQFGDDQYRDTLEMPVGTYEVTLKEYVLEGRYKGRVAREGSVTANVKADETVIDPIVLHANYMYINISLENLPGAIVWVGEEGFEPSDEDLVPLDESEMFFIDTENFEVVVEFEGERKRYTSPASEGMEFFIKIVREEPVEMGEVVIEVITGDIIGQSLTWKW